MNVSLQALEAAILSASLEDTATAGCLWMPPSDKVTIELHGAPRKGFPIKRSHQPFLIGRAQFLPGMSKYCVGLCSIKWARWLAGRLG